MGKVVFEINTKGICLLCLSESSEVVRTGGGCNVSQRTAFKMLLRYLKINVLKLCNFSSSFLETLDAVEESSAEVGVVAMCRGCCEVIMNFYELYEEFERIRLQLDKCVESLYESMLNGENRQERVREYQRRLRTLTGADLFTASFGDALKKEILQKCASKVQAEVPRISVAKLPCDDVRSSVKSVSQFISSSPIVTFKKTFFGNANLPTSKRSKTKFTTQFRTTATVSAAPTAVDQIPTNPNILSNDCLTITEDLSKRMGVNDDIDEEYDDPPVKVEIEMETPESNPYDRVQEYDVFAKTTKKREYVYFNGSSNSDLNVSSSSSSAIHNFNTGGNTNYNSACRMSSAAISKLNPTTPGRKRVTSNQLYLKGSMKKRRIRKFVPCDVCGKSLRKDYISRHKLIHSGETPYECQYCDSKFRDASLQLLHVKSTHTMIFYARTLPQGTTLAEVDQAIENILLDSETSQECPYCPKKLIEGKKAGSRTHILHMHFDKVQAMILNRTGDHQDPAYEHQIFMGDIPYLTDSVQGHGMQLQHQQQFFDPLS
ncbi:unnamed protein product [Orchesella dallaii]|uniref:C2H2-type domain-containing protein n=1 Tax=Orchesella dallaii TaxID=48710 RepID=A0ABP1RZX2_9HEXA